jgi:Papain family cysteine protease
MPGSRSLRRFIHDPVRRHQALCVALPAALLLTAAACKHHSSQGSDDDSPAASTSPSAGAAPSQSATADNSSPDDDYKPAHPGYVNQRDPKGGFVKPRIAPPPEKPTPLREALIDTVPPDEKLATLKDENGHCGELDVGGDKVYLDCITDDYATIKGAAKSVVRDEDWDTGKPRKIPKVVDHRKDNTEGAMLSQGHSGTCTAFSLTAAADHAAAHFLGEPPALSPMHAWARYHSPSMRLADHDNVGKGLADITTFPYDAHKASEWQHGGHVEHEELHKADSEALVEITNITRLETGNMNRIKSALADGHDVWFSIKGAHGIQHTKKDKDGESMINNFDYRSAGSSGKAGHAIDLAGYQETPKGTFFLIHNSWGPKWGTDGYAWIWEKTLKTNIVDAYVVHVRPTERAHSHHVPPTHKYASCKEGLAPDATTTQCVPPCEDGGPRVNGVCPTAGQCPDGEVNLDGKCELSAPAMDKTMSTGIKVKCGLSGCVYSVPTGTASCSMSRGCNISCAAPRFMLDDGEHGLTCSG